MLEKKNKLSSIICLKNLKFSLKLVLNHFMEGLEHKLFQIFFKKVDLGLILNDLASGFTNMKSDLEDRNS